MASATKVSESGTPARPRGARNAATSNALARVARTLHVSSPVLRLAMTTGLVAAAGCIFPPSIEFEQRDAGTNAAPSITSVRGPDQQELKLGEPFIVSPGQDGDLTVTVFDSDVDDLLYIKVFVDYREQAAPLNARSQCTAGPDMQAETRAARCALTALCTMMDIGLPHSMEIDVYDRPPDSTAELTPPFRATLPPGLKSTNYYPLQCLEGGST
jgi:hypothetical protein